MSVHEHCISPLSLILKQFACFGYFDFLVLQSVPSYITSVPCSISETADINLHSNCCLDVRIIFVYLFLKPEVKVIIMI